MLFYEKRIVRNERKTEENIIMNYVIICFKFSFNQRYSSFSKEKKIKKNREVSFLLIVIFISFVFINDLLFFECDTFEWSHHSFLSSNQCYTYCQYCFYC